MPNIFHSPRIYEVWQLLEEEIFHLNRKSDEAHPLFNPWNEELPEIDCLSASEIRRNNLRNYLEHFYGSPSVLVLGEAPGWRGCRFSGVPFTAEAQVLDPAFPIKGNRSSNLTSRPLMESTATIFWEKMYTYAQEFFAWNCIPFHPYQSGKPLSNRPPSIKEIRAFQPLLKSLVQVLHPSFIIAIGRTAQGACDGCGWEVIPVRHPGHGGKIAFNNSIDDFWNHYYPSNAPPNPG